MKGLTADELARGCKMRDDEWAWSKIAVALHRAAPTVRDAIVAEGYPPALPATRGARWSDATCRRAYELCMYEGLSCAEAGRRLEKPGPSVSRVVKRLREQDEHPPLPYEPHYEPHYEMPYRQPKEPTTCVIGNTYGGKTFCAQRKCEHDACGLYVTQDNLAAFDAFQARRREIENNDDASEQGEGEESDDDNLRSVPKSEAG